MAIDLWRTRPYTLSPLSQWVDRVVDQAFSPNYGNGDGGSTGFQSLPVNVWETAEGYHAALDERDRIYPEGAIDELFSQAEAEAFVAWLKRNRGQTDETTKITEADRRDGVVGFEVETDHGHDIRRDLARTVVTSGWGLLELRPMRLSLEEIFLSLTTDEPAAQAAAEETVHE